MKQLLIVILIFASAISFAQNGTYTIKGKIGKLKKPAVAVFYNQTARTPGDTVYLKKGKFEFKGKAEEPFKASIVLFQKGFPVVDKTKTTPAVIPATPLTGTVNQTGREVLSFIAEPAIISIVSKDSLKNAVVTGSQTNNDNLKLTEALKPVDAIRKKMSEFVKNTPEKERGNDAFMAQYRPMSQEATDLQKQIVTKFISENPDSWLSLEQIKSVIGGYAPDVKVVEPLFNSLSERVRNTKSGKDYAGNLVKLHKTTIGAIAPDFTQNDQNGKPVSLSDFRGKYVLVDFWASWCGPCRAENPHVVATYNEFKDKNFTVLGVSLDRENGRDAWLKAIEKDQLTWTHVSDLKFWNNEAAALYFVRAIPDNFLIGPDGKILGRGLRGDALKEKLAELIK